MVVNTPHYAFSFHVLYIREGFSHHRAKNTHRPYFSARLFPFHYCNTDTSCNHTPLSNSSLSNFIRRAEDSDRSGHASAHRCLTSYQARTVSGHCPPNSNLYSTMICILLRLNKQHHWSTHFVRQLNSPFFRRDNFFYNFNYKSTLYQII